MKRLEYVDGLRALAVLAVVAYHCAQMDPHYSATNPLRWLLREGCHGVELFFVVSGFCLSYPILAALRERGYATFDVAAFAARRIVRLLPTYYAALLLLFGFALLLQHAHVALPASITPGSTSVMQLLRQAAFLDNDVRFVNTSFWTLSVELRWYVVFPIVLWLWTRSQRAFAVVAVAALVTSATRAGSADLLVLPAFMLGIVAAHVRVNGSPFARYAPLAFAPVFGMMILQTPAHDWEFVSPFSEAAMFLLVVSAGELSVLNRVLSVRAVTFVGVASYSIYLVHAPLIGVVQEIGVPPMGAASIAIGAGLIFWWFVERRFVDTPLRGRLIARLSFIKRPFHLVDGELARGLTLRRREAA